MRELRIGAGIETGLAAAAIVGVFLWFASPGLAYYFGADDIMNLRRSWPRPIGELIRDCILIWQPAYRPLGDLAYRLIFEMAGLHPWPFHLVCFALLTGNIFLVYCLAQRLTKSHPTALMSALIGSFHSRMDALDLTPATIYDIGCCTFYLGALLYYVRLRQSGRAIAVAQAAVLILLYLCALDLKEMAVTLPVMILVYELLWGGGRRPVAIGILLLLITVAFVIPRAMGNSAISQSYRPQLTASRFLENWETYVGYLLYRRSAFPPRSLYLLWTGLAAAALLLRSRPLLFSFLFLVITPLPVCFIEPRGLNVFYIPFAGWAMYAAIIVHKLARERFAAPAFALLAVVLCWLHIKDRPNRFYPGDGKSDLIREFQRQVTALHPAVRRGTRILFLDDPFDAVEWTPSSLLQLYYRDPDLESDRYKMPEQRAASVGKTYDIVFDYRQDRVIECQGK